MKIKKCPCCEGFLEEELKVLKTYWARNGWGFISEVERDVFYRWAHEITAIVNRLNKGSSNQGKEKI